jgi:aspartate carbamoyltransferase catalytic subunit
MQQERMREAFVPSIREYAARYQIDSRRLSPRQLLMHPGPVNRGVELSGEVIDGPNSLVTEQVESGLVVRMAILYELLTGGRPRPEEQLGGPKDVTDPTPIREPA